ncbi:16567_t:CDS:2 [Entrophospora sp. SA101]|nr:16567_t:CDS:2 [Entrophospora sp. SA101]CAJ0898416.1 15402_t:CDS:2 [Entrophospora sp. SA101]
MVHSEDGDSYIGVLLKSFQNISQVGKKRSSGSSKSNNFKPINSTSTTSLNSKTGPISSIGKDHNKEISLDFSENDLQKLLSSPDINNIDSKDLLKAATVVKVPPTPNPAAAVITLLASKISALEGELETVGKEMAENIKREVDLEMELDNVVTQKEEEIQVATKPLVIKISQLEADILQYKKMNSISSLDNIPSSTGSSRDLLNNKKQNAETEFNQLKLELEELKKSNENKSNEINELNEIIKNLEKQRDEQGKILDEHQKGAQVFIKDMASEREQWRQKEQDIILNHESIELKMKQKESELSAVQDELMSTIKEKQTMKQKLRLIENELAKTIDEKRKLSDQLTDTKRQLDKFKEQIKSIKLMGNDEDNDNNNDDELLYKKMDKYKQESEVLQQQLETLNKKLSEKDDEQHNLIQTLEKATLQTEKTVVDNEAKFNTLTKDHQKTLNSLQKQHEDEIKKITDQLIEEKRITERKIKSLEMKLEDVSRYNLVFNIRELENYC